MFNYVALGEHKKTSEKLNQNLKLCAEKEVYLKDLIETQKTFSGILNISSQEKVKSFISENPWYFVFVDYLYPPEKSKT
ncbi:MAG: hypothetical protein KJ906_02085 [Nanoarchaeota archaeon]|nr:hypothetical protein [Nanoarchaeota archaeon]